LTGAVSKATIAVMKAAPVSYKNLQRFFIRLKAGQTMTLGAALQKHLRVTAEEAKKLIRQGSVWDGERKMRLQDESMTISGQLLRGLR